MALTLSMKRPLARADSGPLPDWRKDPELIRLQGRTAELNALWSAAEAESKRTATALQAAQDSLDEAELAQIAGRLSANAFAKERERHSEARTAAAAARFALRDLSAEIELTQAQLAEATRIAKGRAVADLRAQFHDAVDRLDAALTIAAGVNAELAALLQAGMQQFPMTPNQDFPSNAGLTARALWPDLSPTPSVMHGTPKLVHWRKTLRQFGYLN